MSLTNLLITKYPNSPVNPIRTIGFVIGPNGILSYTDFNMLCEAACIY